MLHARGLTVLLVEQNVGVAAAVAHEAKVLQGGRIAYSGPAAGLLDNEEVLAQLSRLDRPYRRAAILCTVFILAAG